MMKKRFQIVAVITICVAVFAGSIGAQISSAPPTKDIVFPYDGRIAPSVYAPAGTQVHLIVPIRYCYDNAKAINVTRQIYDEFQPVGEIAKPTDQLAKLEVESAVTHGGRVLDLTFVMPANPASLQIWYRVAFSTPYRGPRSYDRNIDVQLVPESRTWDSFVDSLR